MRDLFRAELLRFRSWAIAGVVLHLLVLGFLTRVVDLAQQPLLVYRVFGGVYALAGLPWTPQGEAAMRDWERRNPRHKLGSYGYALEDYGWNRERVEQAFGSIADEWRGR